MEDLFCDSSSLISLTGSCLDNVVYYLSDNFKLRFVIPPFVEYESITRPIASDLKQYSFSAIKIKKLLKDKVIVKVDKDVQRKTERILYLTNNSLFVKGKPITLLQKGEAEMISLASELGVNNILIDERTTRMMIEAPFRMKEHMEKEFGVNIMVNNGNLREFSEMVRGMQVIRSSELLIVAFENGFFNDFGDMKKDALQAALYKIKFSGCSISFDEISDYIKSVK
jgi:hypothetical protein